MPFCLLPSRDANGGDGRTALANGTASPHAGIVGVKRGMMAAVLEKLPREQLGRSKVEAVSLDRTLIKVPPEGTGARKKTGRKPSAKAGPAGAPRFIWWPRMLVVR